MEQAAQGGIRWWCCLGGALVGSHLGRCPYSEEEERFSEGRRGISTVSLAYRLGYAEFSCQNPNALPRLTHQNGLSTALQGALQETGSYCNNGVSVFSFKGV